MSHESVPERFRPALEAIVRRLADGDYQGVARDHSPYLGQDGFDLGMWARDYPDSFVPLPAEAWEVATAFEMNDEPGAWGWSLTCGARRKVGRTCHLRRPFGKPRPGLRSRSSIFTQCSLDIRTAADKKAPGIH